MEQYKQAFLQILAAALKGERAQPAQFPDREQWQKILKMARQHQVLPLVFEASYHLPGLADAPFAGAVRRQVVEQVFIQARKTSDFLALNQHLRQAGAAPLVVKGIICRDLYPNPDHRLSSDEDVLIAPEQFGLCHTAMQEFGMSTSEPEVRFDRAYEIPYNKKGSPLYIELHKSLFPPESEAYGDLNRFFDGIFDRAMETEIQGTAVLTMAPTDHLFYLICHAFKHFLHSGFGIRQVCDIVMFARRWSTELDWEQILDNCRRIRADRFAAALFRMGRLHLGVEVALPPCWQMDVDEMPMLEDLLASGLYGDADMNRKHSSNITLTAVADEKQGRKTSSGVLKSLFPAASSLEKRYPYLQKYPALLPVAWVSRIATYGKNHAGGTAESAAESIRIGNERVALMQQYGILEPERAATRQKVTVSIPQSGAAVYTACGFMLAAALIRLAYYLPMTLPPADKLVHLWMPVAAAAIFLLGFAMGGKWTKPGAIAAVWVGVAFFIIKATGFAPVHQTLCTILYLGVLVLFTATLLGLIPTKKLLYPLFGLPLAYHLLVEDTKYYFFADPPVPVRNWMPEISVLCIMAALLSLSVSLIVTKDEK